MALTLWQPWAGIVAAGIKRVENRDWAPPRWLVGQQFAIHAGKRWDDEGATFCAKVMDWGPNPAWPPLAQVRGAVIAVATLAGCAFHDYGLLAGFEDQAPWFFGPYGWLLRDVVAIEPVPCRGFQKLWALPAAVEAEVRRRVEVPRS